jgi:hypothetical protein
VSSLEVVTTPAGATIYFDDARVGTSPIVLATVAAGDHQLRVEKDGYAAVAMAKVVRAGRDEAVSIVLARAGAEATARPPSRPGSVAPVHVATPPSAPPPTPAHVGSNDPPAEPNPPHVARPGEKANPYD